MLDVVAVLLRICSKHYFLRLKRERERETAIKPAKLVY